MSLKYRLTKILINYNESYIDKVDLLRKDNDHNRQLSYSLIRTKSQIKLNSVGSVTLESHSESTIMKGPYIIKS